MCNIEVPFGGHGWKTPFLHRGWLHLAFLRLFCLQTIVLATVEQLSGGTITNWKRTQTLALLVWNVWKRLRFMRLIYSISGFVERNEGQFSSKLSKPWKVSVISFDLPCETHQITLACNKFYAHQLHLLSPDRILFEFLWRLRRLISLH